MMREKKEKSLTYTANSASRPIRQVASDSAVFNQISGRRHKMHVADENPVTQPKDQTTGKTVQKG